MASSAIEFTGDKKIDGKGGKTRKPKNNKNPTPNHIIQLGNIQGYMSLHKLITNRKFGVVRECTK